MKYLTSAFALFLASVAGVQAQDPKAVYAHFMVGIVAQYTIEDWKTDIQQAQEIGIDGFVLNCAPPRVDDYTPQQLANAYAAAQELNFKTFISFDFHYWTPDDTSSIVEILSNYSSHPAQAYYNGGALVSSFVGDNMDWNAVKSALGDQKITALPNVQDPTLIPSMTTGLDGAFSWYAWPTGGDNSVIEGPITTVWDQKFIDNLGDKPYMAPVSPWFFTHFKDKNWVFICEEQPAIRWQQMLDLKPELVEIVTWNDFGESHYISGSEPHHSDDGSSAWAADFPHDAWRTLMRPYITAYKAGADAPSVDTDELVYWYRPTPWNVQCSNDQIGVPTGREFLDDVVFVSTLLTEPAELTVTSGDQQPVTLTADAGIHTFNFTMGVGAQQFKLSRGDTQILGGTSDKEISASCDTYNYNAYVGSF